jgi:protein lysine acetyltransferase
MREARRPRTGTCVTAPGPKTVLTEASGHIEIDVPRDRAGTFTPQIVRTRRRRLSGQLGAGLLHEALTGRGAAALARDCFNLRGRPFEPVVQACVGRADRPRWPGEHPPSWCPGDVLSDREQIVADLAGLDLLADATQADLAGLATLVTRFVARPGEVLMRRGDDAEEFMLLTAGEVRVVAGPDGAQTTDVVGEGSIVGELSLLRAERHASTVTAITETRGLKGGSGAFARLLGTLGARERVVARTRQRLALDLVPVPVTLRDGTTVRLRPVYPDDQTRLMEGSEVASAQSRYRRFFTSAEISEAAARYLTDVDYVDHFVWVAIDSDDVAIGGASYVRSHAHDPHADISFSIADEYQNRGLGGLLLGALAVAARHHGISRFTADVLHDNRPMRAILERAGIEWEPAAGPVLHGVSEVPDSAAFGITPDTAHALGVLVDEIGTRAWQSRVTPSPPPQGN